MTRCKHCCYNDHLKSSVYNPSGQRYELQLTAYNAMTNHLRRVLLAKSVVDCGNNENLFKKNVKYKKTATSAREVKESVSQNIINRLAYDTKNHPHVSASMNWILNCNQGSNNNIEKKNKLSNSADSNEGSGVQDHRCFSSIKSYKCELRAGSPVRKAINRSSQPRDRVSGSISEGLKITDNRDSSEREAAREIKERRKGLSRSKSEEVLNMKNFRAVVPCVASNTDISLSKTSEFLRSMSKINSDKLYNENSQFDIIKSENDKDLIYVEFVYEITQEIMDRGYYEDRDIEMVFEKHVKRNFDRLKKEKMFEEIKFLKKSFGMNYCDYEENEEDDYSEIITTENYLKINNRIEKNCHQHYNKRDSDTESELKKGIIFIKRMKNEILNDNDKEILNNTTDIILSEEEALNTLLDMNFDNEKAVEIVKSLKNRSNKENFQSFNENR